MSDKYQKEILELEQSLIKNEREMLPLNSYFER